jgi:leucyl aminopeptidase
MMSASTRGSGLVFVIEKKVDWSFGPKLKALDHKSGGQLQSAASHLSGPIAMLAPASTESDVSGILVLEAGSSVQEVWSTGRKLYEYLSKYTQIDSWSVVDDRNLDSTQTSSMLFHLMLGFESCRPPRSLYKADLRPGLELLPDTPLAATVNSEYAALKESIHFARECIAAPPNDLFPAAYAQKILEHLSGVDGVEVKVFDVSHLKAMRMNCLCAVGQGSDRPPVMVVIKLVKNGQDPSVALIGKGVTYDTGGLSLKPASSMAGMHRDMAGAAVVVGAIEALARDPNGVSAYGVIGLAENMPDGRAYRPNDVLRAASGKTVEVLNTDAEGRLVLADVLWYAQKELGCTSLIDVATLTGAVLVALGNKFAGLFCNDPELRSCITTAASTMGEPIHYLPYDSFCEDLQSQCADIKNIAAPGVGAGASIGAAFLSAFVERGTRWAHLDIAGICDNKPPLVHGYGIKTLWRALKDQARG